MQQKITHFRQLNVYSLAKNVANIIYEMSKVFPSKKNMV
jgi:hypothetical protein